MRHRRFREQEEKPSEDNQERQQPVANPEVVGRMDALDVARGMAIALMILSHSVMGLMHKSEIPDWGMVPVHLITKFSSTLFFLVFGLTLRLFFVKYANSPLWPEKRNRLWIRAFEIFFIYKFLTIAQMYGTYPTEQILETFTFERFPDFVEVLGFYAFALLWIPLLLPWWKKIRVFLRVLLPLVLFFGGNALGKYWDFGGYKAIETILVEYDGRYTFGQFQRGAVVLIGLLLGDWFIHFRGEGTSPWRYRWGVFGLAITCLAGFLIANSFQEWSMASEWSRISNNTGKHPPNLTFMLFSLAGALSLYFSAQLSGILNKTLFWPFRVIGRHSLFAFSAHILIIFVVLRNTFDLKGQVEYTQALHLSMVVFGATLILIGIMNIFTRGEE